MVSDDSKSSQNPINTTNSSKAKHLSRLSNNSDNTLYLGKRIIDKGGLEGDVRDYKWLEGSSIEMMRISKDILQKECMLINALVTY